MGAVALNDQGDVISEGLTQGRKTLPEALVFSV